jgi:NADH:ubiquinone reductase (H+-translocating)
VGPHRVVVLGGGFGGLQAALALRRGPVEVTLIDRRNYHLFQPLSYQVATGALSPGQIAYPLRAMFKRDANVRVLLAEVRDIDLEARELRLESVDGLPTPAAVPYDALIVSGGSHYSYFGHDEWREVAAEVKSLESAVAVRSRILRAFEAAEMTNDPAERAGWLTFVVVGGGPTGVEMAGQIAELARDSLRRDFREADPGRARILLVEAAEHLLASFSPSLSEKAAAALRRIGVTPLLGSTIVAIDDRGVTFDNGHQGREQVPARTVIWAAGVVASPLAARLGALSGAEVDRAGRVTVESDLTLPGHPEVFAIGDMVRVHRPDGSTVTFPGVAPVAMQQGRYAARAVLDRLQSRSASPFRYHDKGNVATIGRGAAVVEIKQIRISGYLGWIIFAVVHLWFLVGFQNRLLVMTQWLFSFVTRGRGARLITTTTKSDQP